MFITKLNNKKIFIAAIICSVFLIMIFLTGQNQQTKEFKIKKTFIKPPQTEDLRRTGDINIESKDTSKENIFQQQLPIEEKTKVVPEKADSHLNRTTNNINVAYLWLTNNKLKVLTVMTINDKTNKTGIVTIPVFTRIKGTEQNTTIGEICNNTSRQNLIKILEQTMEIKINNYVSIEQKALEELSNFIGPFNVNGENISMALAFEETSSGKRHDDQDIVRALGKHMMNPVNIVKIPGLLWFSAHNIDTNMLNNDIWHMVSLFKKVDYATMKKVPLDGEDSVVNGQKIREVSAETWHNVIYQINQ